MSKDIFDTHPRLVIIVFLVSGIIGFFGSDILYGYLSGIMVPRFEWWVLKTLVQTAILFLYLVPLAIGVLLTKLKYVFFQIVGLFFCGIGLGVVVKIALIFTCIINPYRF
jgi:hypothetical protein